MNKTIKSIKELGTMKKIKGYPSPLSWRDQVMYFLMPDRFSDGHEKDQVMYDYKNPDKYKTDDLEAWKLSGDKFMGGTLQGVTSKLDYLKNLGITTLWLGPVFKQRADLETYHGYGIQNFLEVDPRFGTKNDLVELVKEAHRLDMYVILDIIYNHTGNNWFYDQAGAMPTAPYRYEPKYDFGAWRDGHGNPITTITSMEDAVWPSEFQNVDYYTRAGSIGAWDEAEWENPLHPETEFRRGDFYDLKDLDYNNPEVIETIVRVYQYWIELTNCDGYRIDTVKHVPWEISRKFCASIHEYSEYIGKDNFLLLGEVTGGPDMRHSYLELLGRNVDAILDIGGAPSVLEGFAKGISDPKRFFDQFTDKDVLGSHREIGRYHVSVLDDHDKVGRDKRRFAAGNDVEARFEQVAHGVGIQLTTLGIPCIYYGTEQAMDGDDLKYGWVGDDRFLRETMFSSAFGAFETTQSHCFNEQHPTYLRVGAIAKLRGGKDTVGLALRRGRQYNREISVEEGPFQLPGYGGIVAWSRIIADQEVLIVHNTNGTASRSGQVTVHGPFYKETSELEVLYDGAWPDAKLNERGTMEKSFVPLNKLPSGRVTVDITLPPAGMMILGSS